ncbi:MAG: hypothetical protein QOG30_2026 [Acidimicrobiaceae bacterium]|jgi:glycosyltransferase involved in cell wall biosynthesis
MATIGIVRPGSEYGLMHSAEIVAGVLETAGHDVHRHDMYRPSNGARFDLVILFERIVEHWLGVASVTALIPNPEWFLDEFVDLLGHIDLVLAKTHDAVAAFEARGCDVVHTGFTSRDQFLPDVERRPGRWLHVAGSSRHKGTDTLVDVWAANPDFPQLTILQPPGMLGRPPPANVSLVVEHLPDAVVQFLQNRSGVHVCPSEAEGWGHYIVEGLSVGAVVLTTDAPPMNEVVTPARGMLCAYASSTPMRFGQKYAVAPDALEATVRATLEHDPDDLLELGRRGREWYLENHAAFVTRLTDAVDDLTRAS